jgi:hypothetical protein
MTRTLYKFTNEHMCTQNNTRWVINEWKETDGIENELCNGSWLHAYEDPYVAALMYPVHLYWHSTRFFKAEGDGKFLSHITKCGVTRLRLVEEIPLPVLTAVQRTKIAIYCTLEVCQEVTFVQWANNYLNNVDRSEETAEEVLYDYDDSNTRAFVDNAIENCVNSIMTTDDPYYVASVISNCVAEKPDLDLIDIIQKVLKESEQ